MTLNCVIALVLRFSPNSIALLAKCVTVVEYRPIMSLNIVSQFQSSTFGHSWLTLQRGISAIAELPVLPCCMHCSIHRGLVTIKFRLSVCQARGLSPNERTGPDYPLCRLYHGRGPLSQGGPRQSAAKFLPSRCFDVWTFSHFSVRLNVMGALKTRELTTREWTTRHEDARVDNAGVDNAGSWYIMYS